MKCIGFFLPKMSDWPGCCGEVVLQQRGRLWFQRPAEWRNLFCVDDGICHEEMTELVEAKWRNSWQADDRISYATMTELLHRNWRNCGNQFEGIAETDLTESIFKKSEISVAVGRYFFQKEYGKSQKTLSTFFAKRNSQTRKQSISIRQKTAYNFTENPYHILLFSYMATSKKQQA